ncbi:hypothetical protein SCG7109_AO_00050 [Chlamydiales bacterium SCGC AG-110-M15]|nr:hypothetical protein SCG7109_AO_00050 [Chlamydiales bacterium SCGC AG-110-M15]
MKEQILNFTYAFSQCFLSARRLEPPKSWALAFALLRDAILGLPKEGKKILFFDEVPWLDSPRSGFLPALEHFWNAYVSRDPNVIVILCGSAASWMIEKVLANRGGLHGRLTKKMRLLPFSLSEAEAFLQSREVDLPRKQLIELYMVMGGVPQYLKQVEPGLSVSQVINEQCFSSTGYMYDEFSHLYASLFGKYRIHLELIRTLAKNKCGLSQGELLKQMKRDSSGEISHALKELEESGFIKYSLLWGKRKSGGKYRLIDEFTYFYLKWMADAEDIDDKSYWLKKHNTASWRSWAGYAFESICLKHVQEIKGVLGIQAVGTSISTWHYRPKRGVEDVGAQVDLIIDRNDDCINLCELKFYSEEFTIDKDYARKLEERKELFAKVTKTRKALYTTLISTYGTKANNGYDRAVQSQLTIDDLFVL